MSDMLLINIGSHGDINPFVGLGVALQARGHAVTLMTNDHFEGLVQQAGLNFVSMGTAEEYDQILNNPDLWNPRKNLLTEQSLLTVLSVSYNLIAERYKPGHTILVASGLVPGARIAQEKLGIPLATVLTQPIWLRSVHELPKSYVSIPDWIGPWGRRLIYWLIDYSADRLLARSVNGFRATLGLPPVRRFLRSWWFSPQRIIGLWPEWFAPPQPDWPPNTSVMGFIHYDSAPTVAERGIPTGWQDTIRQGTDNRPIVFTPGSAMKHGHDFFAAAAEACRQLGRRGLLLTQYPDQLPPNLPDSVQHFDYLPFGQLLPMSSAIVHHGGLQTAAQALAAGIPQLISPMNFDQFDNAYRLSKLGVAQSLSRKRFTAKHVADTLSELLNAPTVAEQCRRYAMQIQNANALEQTCHLIEALSGKDCDRR
ncbi:glycosyltransferase [Candidatus Poribacteria bacterium]|nr:glycosyltransferase [Candidatus Poribacteria bacterium]